MGKRAVTELQTIAEGSSKTPAHGDGDRPQGKQSAAEDEMGEFEDAWEDEIESDEEVVDNSGGDPNGSKVCS
jgi:ribosome assembly protein RRB1